MDFIHYDDIADFTEDALDCLSIEALLDEFFIEEETGLYADRYADEGEYNAA